MKTVPTKIPHASQVFKSTAPIAGCTIAEKVERWLNTDMLEAIRCAEPRVEGRPPVIIGKASTEVPDDYWRNRDEIEQLTRNTLEPLGYRVEFADDGCGQYQVCYLTWNT